MAADAFGAAYTWFSVQGTSTPIMAMILTVCNRGDKIILPRNIHRSVLSGLIFSGARPIFIHPNNDPEISITHGITSTQVSEALRNHPEAKAVFVINPTYYGFAGNLREIVQVAHERNIPVLVDEAHGSHIHFHERLPLSAMEAGADLAATSVHKLGGSLTQSSILNLQGSLISPHRVQTTMNMLTTTSTSYVLLASLDVARRQLALHGRGLVAQAIVLAEQARQAINSIPGLYCPGEEMLGKTDAVYDYDPTKLVIFVRNLSITGYDAKIWLRTHYRIQVELSDLNNILCVVTSGDDYDSIDQLITALRALSRQFSSSHKRTCHVNPYTPTAPRLALSPHEAFYSDTEIVSLESAVGRIVAEWVLVYPPGIPLILPGELLDLATLHNIIQCKNAGLTVFGVQDNSLKTISVVQGLPV